MAFDAAMISFVTNELNENLKNAKIEKVYQSQKEEFVFLMKNNSNSYKLLINAGSSNPRICITNSKLDNPPQPSALCMLMRKHLNGAKLLGIEQIEFERIIKISFSSYDEMGYQTNKYLMFELMGKFSNLTLTNADGKILAVVRPVDFTFEFKRKLLPGAIYEYPEKQDKFSPLDISREAFNDLFNANDKEKKIYDFVMNNFYGFSKSTIKEIAYRASNSIDGLLSDCSSDLFVIIKEVVETIKELKGSAYAFVKDEKVYDFSFMKLTYLENDYTIVKFDTYSELVNFCFEKKSTQEKISQRGNDIVRIIRNAENRITKKLAKHRSDLLECEEADKFKLFGELINANIYKINKGDSVCDVLDYYSNTNVKIPLDTRLSASQNSQKYYKKYRKLKSAKEHLNEQISLANAELNYIISVKDNLSRCVTEADLQEIREELFVAGYGSKIKNFQPKKKKVYSIYTFTSQNGYKIYCGKNNIANDYLTLKLASKNDWWFHVKGIPGSHVVLCVDDKGEPDNIDFTQAASIACLFSQANGASNTEVDYTLIKNIKKPVGSKPGFVIYNTNWSCVVSPDKNEILKLQNN